MNTRQKGQPPPPLPASITLRDVYYVLFRHKWLIAILAALGVGSALAVYWLAPFPYISEAQLYLRYTQDAAPVEMDGASTMRTPGDRGANILNTELEMLDSLDTAKAAAKDIGPENMAKLLGLPLTSNNAGYYDSRAGEIIRGNLKAEVPPKTDVILLHYSDRDPGLARQVLSSLISAYKTNYVLNHLSMGFNDQFFQEQSDVAKAQLDEKMSQLETEKEKAAVTSVPDAKRVVTDMQFKMQENINQVRLDMADLEAVIRDLQQRTSTTATNASETNHSTNIVAAALPEPPTPEVLDKYRTLNDNLAARRVAEQRWMGLSPNSERMKNFRKQREAAEADVEKFEAANPGLLAVKSNQPGSPAATAADPVASLSYALVKQRSLMNRFNMLTNQLAEINAKAKLLNVADEEITKAETETEVAEAKYKHLRTRQEQASNDAILGNKVSNIITSEEPTPGARDSKKIFKVTGGVLGFFLALAFGLPFFIEMVLDQSFKQPLDVKARIDAPFFITIPKTNGHHKLAALNQAHPAALLSANGTATSGPGTEDVMVPPPANGQLAAWNERSELRPFFETLRDRLMTYFEMINLTHKPKLVAVTSCGPGAGVTTTAAGLASSLSEIGEGNVLLVNMNVRDGEAHHFYKGKLACGIEDVLARGNRDQAQVQEHLYVVGEAGAGQSLPRVLPKRFSHLVPLMKASDYDYIIFDMPPVSEISITPRLARFMDMVLLVIESGKTSREAGMHAASLLAESKTNVGLVLNKNRSYLPKRLQNS